jgi:phosphoglycolate phosphatase
MNKLALFDIDKTLIKRSKNRSHAAAFSKAFKEIYGIDTTIDIINHHGMTDQQIIIDVLKKNGLDDQTIKSKLRECIKAVISSFNKLIGADEIIVMDGVPELLKELKEYDVLMGLVTGNLEPIARAKLKKAGLNSYFKVGGFGSDAICRTELTRLAIKKAEEKFCFKADNNVFLFGDTPQDIKAGKGAGTITLGVATGIYSKEQLENAGADFVLENLKGVDKVLKIILS